MEGVPFYGHAMNDICPDIVLLQWHFEDYDAFSSRGYGRTDRAGMEKHAEEGWDVR